MDIDVDVKNRTEILDILTHVPASIIKNKDLTKHNVGVYFQNIPKDISGLSSIEYQTAAELGYFKFDILNNNSYEDITSNEQLEELLNQDPDWNILLKEENVKNLSQISNHFELINMYKPKSVVELAMVISLIRPGKKYLIGKSFEFMKNDIWKKPHDETAYYKKPHAIAYALLIVLEMNKLNVKRTI